MRSRQFLFIILLITLYSIGVLSQEYVPGEIYYGRNNYVEYYAGELPLIFTAPHGGSLTPDEIPDRTYGTTGTDLNTADMAEAVRAAVYNKTGKYPHVIISNLKRIKLDPNREIVEAAQGNQFAEQAWTEYHGFIDDAKALAAEHFGKGLIIDLHGHGHDIQRLEIGYLLNRDDLLSSDSELNQSEYIEKSSVRRLAESVFIDFSQLIRGSKSLGTLLEDQGVPAVPSLSQPDPEGDPYFTGGYSTQRHGSRDGGEIDGIQIEMHYSGIRDTGNNRAAFAEMLTDVIDVYFREHYGWDGIVTEVDDGRELIPPEYLLKQNYPNPFNPSTTISYFLSKSIFVKLEVFNTVGERIRTIVSGKMNAGLHHAVWDGVDVRGEQVASGIYIYRIVTEQNSAAKKMVLLK